MKALRIIKEGSLNIATLLVILGILGLAGWAENGTDYVIPSIMLLLASVLSLFAWEIQKYEDYRKAESYRLRKLNHKHTD